MADITFDPSSVVPANTARLASALAAVGIGAGKAVYVDADGKLNLASALSETAAVCKGVAVNSGEEGQPVTYCFDGEVTFNEFGSPLTGSLDPGQLYIISDTPGGIRPASDLGASEYSGYIGTAKDASTLIVKPHVPAIQTSA